MMVCLEQKKRSKCVSRCVLVLLALSGCGTAHRKYGVADLESQNPSVRIMAIKWAGDNKVLPAVPHLVDCLGNEDKAVRLYAIEALRRVTGTTYGYDYKAAPHRRAAAVKRWQEFLDSKEWEDGGH